MIGNTEKQISTSAKNYADSLIKVGKDGVMTYEAILNDLNTVKEITSESDELVKVLENPSISINTKNEIIDSVFANQISDKTANFLKVLIDKKRFNELDQIIQCYKSEVDDINNIYSSIDVLFTLNTSIAFNFSEDIEGLYITVSERDTNRLIRKIPSDEAMQLAAKMKEIVGMIFDKQA